MHREVRASVRRNRARWLDDQLGGGNWKGVRNLMKTLPVQTLQLQNTAGKLVGGEEKKSNTFAEYLETVQWKKLYANVHPSKTTHLGPTLPILEDNFTEAELRAGLKSLSKGKAAGIDEIPPDLWKILLESKEVV